MKRRNPIARVIRKLRPKIKPDGRRKAIERIERKERNEADAQR